MLGRGALPGEIVCLAKASVCYHRAMPPVLARRVTERRFRRVRFWAFAILAFVAGHDAVFRAEYGGLSTRALTATGEGYWLGLAVLISLVAAVPVLAGIGSLVRLRASLQEALAIATAAPGRGSARVRRSAAVATAAPRSWRAEFAGILPRLVATTVLGFMVQENLPFLAAGHAMPGLAVLAWPYHPAALPVLCLVTVVISAAAAWVRWRGAVLESRLAAARAKVARLRATLVAAPARWRLVAAVLAHEWLLARRLAGRAPPTASRA